MGEYKTPGVYIKEKNAFGNSVVEAATAIPAFIGYTEKAQNGNDDLTDIPWKISSMTEFMQYFGGGPELKFTMDIKRYLKGAADKPTASIFQVDIDTEESDKPDGKTSYAFCVDGKNSYILYYSMMLFFANGGGTCYVVSVGSYKNALKKDSLISALEKLKLEQEITMVVIPEAVNLSSSEDFKDVQTQMLSHCGYTMKNRFALLDIYPKADKNTRINDQIEIFWNNIGSNFLSYGAAYFPWLNTSIVGDRDLTGNTFKWEEDAFTYRDKFSQIDPAFFNILTSVGKIDEFELKKGEEKTINNYTFKFDEVVEGDLTIPEKKNKKVIGKIEKIKSEDDSKETIAKKIKVVWEPSSNDIEDEQAFHQALNTSSYLYQQAMKAIKKNLNLLPPSAAMAGIYTMVDNSRGVWKAPANVTINYVDSPTEDIDDDQQAELNAPMNGKAINVIRHFRGEGLKIWGARTLDGNSLDWRYINVRRTLLFLEESVKNAARAYVFEPNDAGTWINIKCLIENFLRSVWKCRGLAGATPEDAYEVHIGLGDTMTSEDILEGIVRIVVLVAVSHPAEFIEITFQQQMQKS